MTVECPLLLEHPVELVFVAEVASVRKMVYNVNLPQVHRLRLKRIKVGTAVQ